ncbi:TIGR03790 family protein [Desulfopila sp. IMCC35008]|uniref:TIGR03790 family protein n=1 Tax=Desulfopila sp. IMCC35008 TaxID=2653858 RepID=UPI0013D149C5|nr:TIGR03790 family protein [Desulfopila sp. IMCC35008]
MRNLLSILLGVVQLILLAEVSFSATADELVVVVNSRMAGAEKLAHYYMQQRRIPKENVLLTSLILEESMSREEYEEDLVRPLLQKIRILKKKGTDIYGVVLTYGVPLKVRPPQLSWDDEELLQRLREEKGRYEKNNKESGFNQEGVKELVEKISRLAGSNKKASVDSELSLAKVGNYELDGWIPNPYFLGFQRKKLAIRKDDVLLVSRLDGPDLQTVYRMIDDSLHAEKKGLDGVGYFDARWAPNKGEKLSGYELYDNSLHKAAEVVGKRLKVVTDQSERLFQPGEADRSALYCGWYSLANYVDAFDWERGAVGYHIASSECSTLRKKNTKVWCPNILKDGAAATIGPVHEPYVSAFPLPEMFFSAFTEGYMNLGESFLVSIPYISWQMVLIGDPLYQPFKPISGK